MEDEDALPERETLLYDYFKHLTSLCLVSLGGVLALAQNPARPVPGKMLVMVLLVLGLAALLAFSGTGAIVEARFTGKSLSKRVNILRAASPVLLSIGLGMFIYIFAGTLKL